MSFNNGIITIEKLARFNDKIAEKMNKVLEKFGL